MLIPLYESIMSAQSDEDDTKSPEEEFLELVNYKRAQDAVADVTRGQSNNELLAQLLASQNATNRLLRDQTKVLNDMVIMMNKMQIAMGNLSQSIKATTEYRSDAISSSTASLIGLNTNLKLDKNEIIATLLLQLFNLVLSEMKSRDIQYHCSRTLDVTKLKHICRAVMKVKSINAPIATDPSTIYVTQHVASPQKGALGVMTLETMHELLGSSIALPMISVLREVHKYLLPVKEVLPTIYGDVFNALSYPFIVSKPSLQLNCDWAKIVPRDENRIERVLAEMMVTQRYKYIEEILSGSNIPTAMSRAAEMRDEKSDKKA